MSARLEAEPARWPCRLDKKTDNSLDGWWNFELSRLRVGAGPNTMSTIEQSEEVIGRLQDLLEEAQAVSWRLEKKITLVEGRASECQRYFGVDLNNSKVAVPIEETFRCVAEFLIHFRKCWVEITKHSSKKASKRKSSNKYVWQ